MKGDISRFVSDEEAEVVFSTGETVEDEDAFFDPTPDIPEDAEGRLLTPDEFAAAMAKLSGRDAESRHMAMDSLMAQTLRRLGYEAGVEVFDNTCKWYC